MAQADVQGHRRHSDVPRHLSERANLTIASAYPPERAAVRARCVLRFTGRRLASALLVCPDTMPIHQEVAYQHRSGLGS
jgi:hypothetical protein